MSTYLNAITIGQLEADTQTTSTGLPVTAYAPPRFVVPVSDMMLLL